MIFRPTLSVARVSLLLTSALGVAATSALHAATEDAALTEFKQSVQPILQSRCYECHGDGAKKAEIAFDELTTKDQLLHNSQLWLKVLRNTRSHIMPPPEEPQLTAAQQHTLETWIETGAFGLDLTRDDPGRTTLRRLNRAEYRNTIRDLLGVDFDAEHALAADDIGYGFDNISDVLTLSPMRMEKFIEAAQTVVKKAVPTDFVAISEQLALGPEFLTADGKFTGDPISFYTERTVGRKFEIPVTGDYKIVLTTAVDGRTRPDPGRATVNVMADGKEFSTRTYTWADCAFFSDERTVHLERGSHQIDFHLTPLEPVEKQTDKMDFKVNSVQIVGPLDRKDWLPAPNYAHFFPRPKPPTAAAERRTYAREVLGRFANKAYRRPVPTATLDRLVQIAEGVYSTPDTTFETGIARAMVAVLASPSFLFRLEELEPAQKGETFANVDEYSLAARLSYFLWSSTPDSELLNLASTKSLRKNLAAQVKRMLADPKSAGFVENFSGQWLLSREILHVALNRPIVLAREGIAPAAAPRRGTPAPPVEVTPEQRQALKREAEVYFDYVAHADRDVLELIESNYVFRNETLAKYYGQPAALSGPEMRRIDLPDDDPRGGGVITMGSTLAVTSNPTRTSPVKRGKWILENILGAPPPPPPPAVPSLEETEKRISDRQPTQRELLAIHREDALCASCHSRMDPLGLALENFNALGLYRTQELKQPIDSTGELATGEKFQNVRELKKILVTQRRTEIYRTLAEKLLIYALGRGVDYYDMPTVDRIVARLEQNGGRFSELLMGVIESSAFQKARLSSEPAAPQTKSVAALTANSVQP